MNGIRKKKKNYICRLLIVWACRCWRTNPKSRVPLRSWIYPWFSNSNAFHTLPTWPSFSFAWNQLLFRQRSSWSSYLRQLVNQLPLKYSYFHWGWDLLVSHSQKQFFEDSERLWIARCRMPEEMSSFWVLQNRFLKKNSLKTRKFDSKSSFLSG